MIERILWYTPTVIVVLFVSTLIVVGYLEDADQRKQIQESIYQDGDVVELISGKKVIIHECDSAYCDVYGEYRTSYKIEHIKRKINE